MFGEKHMLDSLNEHINKKLPCYVERAIKPTFNWEDVIGLLQYSADSDVGNPIGILNYKLPDAHLIQGIQLVREYLNENLDKKIANTQMCVTMSIRDNPSYKNDCDMIIWATQGITEFSFGEGEDEVKRLLQPGDIIYVPEELAFKMTPMNSRAFVSFGLEKVKDDNENL
jgi:hypothetical protein